MTTPRERLVQALMGPEYNPVRGNALTGRYRTHGKGSVRTDDPTVSDLRDEALSDLERDRNWLRRQGLGLASGMGNPFGLTGWGARGLAGLGIMSPENAHWWQDSTRRWDANAPGASMLGTALLPYGAGRAIGLSPGFLIPGMMLGQWGGRNLYDAANEDILGREPAGRAHRRMEDAREYGAAGY